MRKISLVLLAVVVLMVAACGGQNTESTTPAPTPQPTPAPEPAQTAPEPTTPVTTPVEPTTPTEPAPATNEITLQGRAFSQTELTVSAGTTVTFRIVGGTHIIRVNKVGGGNAGGSPTIRESGSFEFMFAEAGEYEVIDTINKGRLRVTVE